MDKAFSVGNWKMLFRGSCFDGFFKWNGYKCGEMTLLSEEEYKAQSFLEKLKYVFC